MEMITDKFSNAITVYEVKKSLEKDLITIFDIRDLKDFEKLRIKGSIHVNINEIIDHVKKLPLDRIVAIICYRGGMSGYLTRILNKKGFNNVKSVEGGFISWIMEIEPHLIDELE